MVIVAVLIILNQVTLLKCNEGAFVRVEFFAENKCKRGKL